ncbi:YczE/YyaS/YitT family protein [Levilactobacillus tujiorum]|uniref:YczE/YyaS/YitT family protein n=1 Tax=Levilactobacillus tujiorum TaxID=2912243 RepID=UPI001B3B2872|nr:hypothetical protein [Levilactobacillus tujiorum]MCH5464194.1 hypothetical protein [Levilactobacillus tujiorum]
MTIIKNSLKERWLALILGLVINAFGSGLTVAANMGASPWMASEVNLSEWLRVEIGWPVFIVSCLAAVANQILLRHWDGRRFFGEIGFMFFVSFLVNFFTAMFYRLGILRLSMITRGFLAVAGVIIFCIAISLYQRANLVMHPNDDTTNILRFMYCHGNVLHAQLLNFIPPVTIIVVSWLVTHQLFAINLGTLFALLFTGTIINLTDRFIWPSLQHNFRTQRE